MSVLKNVCGRLNPKYPFNYLFADDTYNKQYQSEIMVGQLAKIFAFLAIFISCMGLFGLTIFMAAQRTREISIRKVMGANVSQILALLFINYGKLIFVAALIAFPISWLTMNKWLQGFAYRIQITWWVFLLAGLCVSFIAVFTISFHAIKAAIENPVKSLKTE